MGYSYEAICQDCGEKLRVNDGPGMFAHNRHCDRCGKSKFSGFEELDKLLGQGHNPSRAYDDVGYQAKLEQLVKPCRCKGRFRFEAPPRCPHCRGTSFTRDPNGHDMLYD